MKTKGKPISDMDFCGAPDEARKENGKWRERKKRSRFFLFRVNLMYVPRSRPPPVEHELIGKRNKTWGRTA